MISDIHKTVIVTGASQGIGAGLVKAFLDRRYNVVATSRKHRRSFNGHEKPACRAESAKTAAGDHHARLIVHSRAASFVVVDWR